MKNITGKKRNILLGAIIAGILLTGIVTIVLLNGRKAEPVFHSGITQSMETGTYRIMDYISAVDYKGNSLPIEFVGLWDMDGEELTDCYDPVTKEIKFEQSGIYTLRLSTVDDAGQKAMCRINIPVNSRKGEIK